MISMNPRRLLSQAALVLGVLLLSAGVQTLAAFSEPSVAPPGADANAPLTTGPNAEAKEGGLLLNTGGADDGLIVLLGNVGIGTDAPTQLLDVAGYVKGTGLCIADDCRTAWSDGGAPGVTPGTSIIYKAPGTYTYTVPDGVTKIQAIVIGGGGGNASACYVTVEHKVCVQEVDYSRTTSYQTVYKTVCYASCSSQPSTGRVCSGTPYTETTQITTVGGGATNGRKVSKIMSVTPGQKFTVIVGAGGGTDSGGAASCFDNNVANGGDASWYDSSLQAGFYGSPNKCSRAYGLTTCGTAPKVASTNYFGTGEPYSVGGGSSGSVEILNLP